MKLNVLERIALLNVIPHEGSVVTLRITRDLQHKLGFTEQELKAYKMKNTTHPDGRVSVTWDEDFSLKEKDFVIGDVATSIIKNELLRLDSQGKLRMEMLSLYEKFVEEKVTPKSNEVKAN